MVICTNLTMFDKFPHLKSIFELEEKITKLNWWEIIKKYKIKKQLRKLRFQGWIIGFNWGIDTLVECGMLKQINS